MDLRAGVARSLILGVCRVMHRPVVQLNGELLLARVLMRVVTGSRKDFYYSIYHSVTAIEK